MIAKSDQRDSIGVVKPTEVSNDIVAVRMAFTKTSAESKRENKISASRGKRKLGTTRRVGRYGF